jgi:hypothetical protein
MTSFTVIEAVNIYVVDEEAFVVGYIGRTVLTETFKC